jgi:hypothetical protein
MTAYRLYFLDAKGAIQARQDFAASSDTEAKTIGVLLWQACADCYYGYELWQTTRRLARESDDTAAPPPAIERIGKYMQKRVLDLQEMLITSQWHAAKSKGLLAATETLRRHLVGDIPAITHRDMMRYICGITGTGMMSLQLVEGTSLKLRGSHGFDAFFDDYFATVERDDCACGVAMKNASQTVVPTIEASPIYAGHETLDVLRTRGAVSCVSTPFLGSDGSIAGMFSLLRPTVWNPAEGELKQLEHIARHITAAITDPLSVEARLMREAV